MIDDLEDGQASLGKARRLFETAEETDTAPELLENAGFVEFTPSKLN